MNRKAALAAIILLWAAIYLPGLGGPELKGEEGRRILPAIAMLETGEWIVPYLNGVPYLRKPPLINWLIAGSFKLTGERTERAARLPSVLAVLALGVTMVWTGSRWLGASGAFTAAIFALTSLAFLDKGRLAEIEAVYVSLCGIAFAFWLAAWVSREAGWRLWLIPGVFLGLAMLTKGPGHLPFFYGMAIPVLIAAGEARQLWSRAHIAAFTVMLLIFGAWAVPYFRAAAQLGAGGVWASQAGNTLGGGSLKLSEWLPNFPRAFSNGLPWLLFGALWWNGRALDCLTAGGGNGERIRLLVRAARWPFVIGFVGLMALPGILPRYTLPLLPAAALLLAAVVPTAGEGALRFWRGANRVLVAIIILAALGAPWIVKPAVLAFPGGVERILLAAVAAALPFAAIWIYRRSSLEPSGLALATAFCVAGGMAVYAVAVMPRMALRDDLRPLGRAITEASIPGAPMHILANGYDPLFFYLGLPCVFHPSWREIPDNAEQILFSKKALKKLKSRWPGASDAQRFDGQGKKDFLLLKLAPERGKNPRPEREHLPSP